ncbi:MAG: XdhC family protein [Deltaproteobacteria bacterium]|nr:XdhC family protein [Deltaproteobacteria bacterium]
MREIYEEILRLLTEGKKVILATVIQQVGSAPRKRGAQMLIRADGSSLGSVGGGRIEAEVLKEAKGVWTPGEAKVLAFHLTGQEVAETEMLCGGNVEVLIEPLLPGLRELYATLLEIKKRGGEVALATFIATEPLREAVGTKGLVFPDGKGLGSLRLEGDALTEARKVIKEKKVQLLPYRGGDLYLEPIFSEPTLYIFGAGHISRHLAPVANMVGFKVIVIDDRAEYANREHLPQADEIWVEKFEGVGQKIDPDRESYMVIATRGHMHDYTVLKQVLPIECRYIGMIGSRRKRDLIYQQLRQEDYTKEELGRVHAPIGLAINAETPEEIAVSIVAELIKVRAEGKPSQEKTWKV